jgi:hypothetical protein
MIGLDELAHANEPWDRVRRLPAPEDYVPGLYRVHQVIADHLLRECPNLTNWEARLLQVIRYQSRDLGPVQRHHLLKLEQRADRRAAA